MREKMNGMKNSRIVTWVAVFSLLLSLCSGLVINASASAKDRTAQSVVAGDSVIVSDTEIASSGVIVGDKSLTSKGVIVGDDALPA